MAVAKHIATSNAHAVHEGQFALARPLEPNGMSGGPVFHLGKDRDGFFVGYAGMITRCSATSDRFRFIDHTFIRQLGLT